MQYKSTLPQPIPRPPITSIRVYVGSITYTYICIPIFLNTINI